MRDLRIENQRVVGAIAVLQNPPHNIAPRAPVGIGGSRPAAPGAGAQVRGSVLSSIPVVSRVTLVYSEITLLEALQQVALQAPGIVWAVIERPEAPRCQTNLYYPDGVLVAGGDLLSDG